MSAFLRAAAAGWACALGRPTAGKGPLRVWLEPTAACGVGCRFCPTGRGVVPAGEPLPAETFRRVLAGLPPGCDVSLHHRGEPLLHPELAAMAGALVRAGHFVRVHTNGLRLDAEARRRLLESGLHLLSLSFDGPDAERYARLRPGGDYARVVENFRALLAERRSAPLRAQVEIIGFPDLADPAGARAALVRVFAPQRPDRVVVRAPHDWTDAPPPAAGERLRQCPHLWGSLAVFADGTVAPCPQDYAGKLALGNVDETPLREIWNGPRLRELRALHAAGRIAELDPCGGCDVPRRSGRGELLGRLVAWSFAGGGGRRARLPLMSPKKAARIAALREALPALGRWLDAGTGGGVVALALRDGRRWTYLESESAARGAAERLLGRPVEPLEKLDELPAASFDGVLLSDRLEHVADDAALLRRCARVLAPGGWLLVTVPRAGRRLYALRRALGRSDAALGHVREGYTPEGLAALLRAEGFEVESTRQFAGPIAEIADALLDAAARILGVRSGKRPSAASVIVRFPFAVIRALDRLTERRWGHGLLALARKAR